MTKKKTTSPTKRDSIYASKTVLQKIALCSFLLFFGTGLFANSYFSKTYAKFKNEVNLTNSILKLCANNGQKSKKISEKEGRNNLVLAPFSYSASPNLSFAGSECPATSTTTITVTDNFTINDLRVGLIADMDSRHHLQATITSPQGTSVLLTSINGHGFVGGMSDWDIQFDDASAGNLNDNDSDDITAPNYENDRTANPEGTLADVDGESANGVWTLAVCDFSTGSGDGGTIVSWKLDFDGTIPCTASGDTPIPAQGTCNGSVPNNDASVTINNILNADRADISTAGAASYDGDDYASAESVSGGSISFAGLQHNANYIVRIYETGGGCFTDVSFASANAPSACLMVTCTGNADAVTISTGVASANLALGAANDSGAELHDSGDQLGLDLTDLILAGETYTIRWQRRNGTSDNPTFTVEESADGLTWTAATGSPFTESVTTWSNNNIVASTNFRYLRITTTNVYDLQIDAVTYSSVQCCGTATYTTSTTQGTCNGSLPNMDAIITLSNITLADRADISSPGAIAYDGDVYASAETINSGSITFNNLAQNKSFIVRLYDGAGGCFTDVTITTPNTPVACPSIPSDVPWSGITCNDTPIIMQNGIAALTCGVTANVATADRYTFAMMNLNNTVPASGRSEITGSVGVYHHSSWHIDQIGNVYGQTINNNEGSVLITASTNYAAGFTGQTSIVRFGDLAGGTSSGDDDFAAGGAIYKIDPTTGQASVFATLPQQSTTFTHTACEGGGDNIRTNSGVGLGNIVFDMYHNQYFVTNFEDGRIYRLDVNGNILDTYDPFGDDNGAAGISDLEELAYGLAIEPGGNRLFFGGVDTPGGTGATAGDPAIHSIDLSATGGFVGTNTATGLGYDNFTGTETLHTTIATGTGSESFLPDNYVYSISDLEFNASGDLIAGIRVGCNNSIATSYNHYAETNIITASGGTYNNVTELDISALGQAGPDDGYGGVASYVDNEGDDIIAVSSADIIAEIGPHGIAVFNDPPNAGEITPLAAISYGVDISGDPKGVGGDIDLFGQCIPPCEITGTNSTCINTTGLVYSAPAGATSYSWSITSGDATINGASNNQTVTVDAGTNNFTIALAISPAAPTTCDYDVTVNPLPTCTASNNGPICPGATLTLNETGGNATSWAWSTNGSATLSSTSVQSPTATGVTNGEIFTVIVTDANGCTSTCTTTAVVNATPSCSASNNGPICTGQTLTLNETGGNATSWNWSTNGSASINNMMVQSPTATGVTNGEVFTVMITDANGCTSTCTTTAVVNDLPTCTASNNGPICTGQTLTLNETGGNATMWAWSTNGSGTFNDASAQSPTVTGAANGEVFTVIVTDANGCTSTCNTTATINPLPTCSIAGATSVVENTQDETYSGPIGMASYAWSITAGDGVIDGSNTGQTVNIDFATASTTIELTITDANGCTSTCVISVNMTTALSCNISGPTEACASTTGLMFSGTAGATTYAWSITAGDATINGASNTQNVTVDAGSNDFTIELTIDPGNPTTCNQMVTINPLPTCTASNNGPICADATLTLNETGGNATSWAWTTNGSGTFSSTTAQSPTVTGVANGEIFTVVITDANGCTSTCTTTAVVNPLPTCNATNNGPICNGQTLTLNETGGNATSWAWSSNGTATFSDASAQSPTATGVTNGEIFTVMITDANGCTSTCMTTAVVNALPTCNATNNGPICIGEDLTLNETGGNATMWAWTTNGTATFNNATLQSPIAVGVTNGEVFTVVITDANGCTSTCTTTAVVNALPTCTASNDGPACANGTLTLNETGGNATVWAWTTNGSGTFSNASVQSPTVTGMVDGEIFTVVITDANGCTSMCTTTATVRAAPACSASNNGPICAGEELMLNETGGEATGWSWTTSGSATFNGISGNLTQNPTVSGAVNGEIFTVVITDANGCTSTCTTTAVVNALPACNATNNGPICDGQTLTLNETGSNATSWMWSTNGSAVLSSNTAQSPTAMNVSNGEIFTVVITDANGCTSTCTTTAVVNALPMPVTTSNSPICNGATLNLMETSGVAVSWLWSSNGSATITNTTDQNPTATNVGNGEVFTVVITDANGCTGSSTTTATVNPLPTCSIAGSTDVLQNTQDVVYSGTAGMTTYAWSITSGDAVIDGAANAENVTVDFGTMNSVLELTITDANGCSSTCNIMINVTATLVCNISGPTEACYATTGLSYSAPAGAATYSWSITAGDATITSATNIQTVTVDAGNNDFTIELTLSPGAPATCNQMVTINPPPTCNATNNGPICDGDMLNLNETGGAATMWAWSTNGTSTISNTTIQNPSVTGAMNGEIFTVIITDANGCTSTCNTTAVVNATPTCTASNSGPICDGQTLTLNETGGNATMWAWSTSGTATFNDANLQSPTVTGAANGEVFTVVITDANGCTSTCSTTATVNVLPSCSASNNGPICEGATLTLMEVGGDKNGWAWSSDGSAVFNDATAQNPTATGVTNGEIFTVIVTNAAGCTSTCTTTAVVNAAPTCTASNNGPICDGQSLTLNETGGNATSWAWSTNGSATFDNTMLQSPTITNAANGEVFTVVITDANGCTSMCTTTAVVNALPTCTASNNGPICTGQTLTLNETGGNATTWAWSSDGSAVFNDATAQSPTATGVVNGEVFTVMITDANGCTSMCTTTAVVNALPTCNASNNGPICAGSDLMLNETGGNATMWAWTSDGSATFDNATLQSPTASGAVNGEIFTVVITDANGCTSMCTTTATVNSAPACMATNDGPICEGATLTLNETGGDATGWMWSTNGSATISNITLQNPTAMGVTNGEIFTVITTDANGCTSTCTTTAVVNPLPVCNISGSSPVVQNTQDVMYSGPAGMTTYAWSVTAGDAVIDGASNAQNVTIDFGTMNSTLELTIVDANGCTSTCTFDVTITNTVVCAITGPTDACANTTGLVFNATAGAATYSWAITAGDATINGANNAQSVTVDAGTSDFTIELTLDPGAPPSCTYDVNIFAIPTCTISNNGPICQGQTLSLSEMGGSATSWNWSSDGASSISDATAQNPTATGVSNGEIFTVVITDANGCTSTCTTTATVNPTPTCTASNDGPICEGQTLTLNETGGNATSWAWSSNAGAVFNNATMQSPTATNVINGEIFTVVITDANGCTSTCTTTAVVNPIPVCNITGSTTALNNTQDAVYSGPAGMATYAWSVTAGDAVIDGANNAQNVTIDFGTMNSTIELTIVDANGCTSTCTIDVTMTATLVCAVSGPTDACQNTAGLVYSGPGGASSYAWSITAGDAVINGASNMQNVTVDGGTSSFTIELTIEPGTSTCSQMVTVNPPPTCTVSNNGPICAGQTLTLFESGGDATSWMWSSNSGASISDVTAQNPMATGVTDGEIFTVIITDANGCTSTCNTTATVNPAITEAALMNITCNDNGSTTDPTDDFITFELNPTGNNLGANYNISVSSGTITPTTAAYGASTTFTLQNGSAGSGNVTVTLLDESNTPCPLEVVITDPGNCSGMQIDYPDYNRPGFPPCADEPCHVIDANLRLGTTNTADNGGGGDQMATTDNDDGITFPNDLRPGINIQITANITNNTGNDAYLYAWADWNADGDFDDAGEAFAAETYTNMGNFDVLLPVFIPSNANQADGIAFRFRLSTDETAISSPCGPAACASDGEVEDYIIMLECPTEICLPPTIQINR